MKIVILAVVTLLLLFGGAFVLEGRLRGCAVSGLVSTNARGKTLTLLAVNYRPGRTYYHLSAR